MDFSQRAQHAILALSFIVLGLTGFAFEIPRFLYRAPLGIGRKASGAGAIAWLDVVLLLAGARIMSDT